MYYPPTSYGQRPISANRGQDNSYTRQPASSYAQPGLSTLDTNQSVLSTMYNYQQPSSTNAEGYKRVPYKAQVERAQHALAGAKTLYRDASAASPSRGYARSYLHPSNDVKTTDYGAYTKQDYSQYQFGGGGLTGQSFYKDDGRANDPFAGSYKLYNQVSTPSSAQPKPLSGADYRYGSGQKSYAHNYLGGDKDDLSRSAGFNLRKGSSFLQQPSSSFYGQQGYQDQYVNPFETSYDPAQTPQEPFSYTHSMAKRQLRAGSFRVTTEGEQYHEGTSSFKTSDPPKKRVKSDIDNYNDLPEQSSVLSGGRLTQPVRQIHSPKFGQRSSRSNNDILYNKDPSQLHQYSTKDSWDPLTKSYQPSLMNYGGNYYAKKSSSFLENQKNPSSILDQQKYSNSSTPSYLYSQYLQNSKSWSAQPSAKNSRIPMKSANHTADLVQCPFTNQQLEQYRARIHTQSSNGEKSEFTQAHNQVYQEILDKLPSIKNENDQNILTTYEKQIVRDELDKVKRGKANVAYLDGEGDTSLSMIHMIFQFYLQSGEYSFFIKRVKNIAQSKMACEGDKLRMQYQYAKPFRNSPGKNNDSSSRLDRSDISLNTAPVGMYQNNDGIKSKMEELYVDSEPAVPPQEDEDILNSRYNAKTMRQDAEVKIQMNELALSKKKHSDPEPRNGSTSLNRQNDTVYRQQFSKSFQPHQAQEVLKAIHEPSFLTQATTASGDNTVKNQYGKKQGASFTDKNKLQSNQKSNGHRLYEDYRSGADNLYNSKNDTKQSEPQLQTGASTTKATNLSPGRLARPLKKKKFQGSQVYNVSPDGRNESLDDSMQQHQPRDRSHDANFLRQEPGDQYSKPSSLERPNTLNAQGSFKHSRPDPVQPTDMRRANEPNDNGFNYSRVNDTYDWLNATQPDQSIGPADGQTQDVLDRGNANYRSVIDERSRERDCNDTANDSMYQRANGRAGEAQGYEDVRRYRAHQQQYMRDGSREPDYGSRGHSQEGNPYYENRSPSPRLKQSRQANQDNDFGLYDPVMNKKEPKANPLIEPDSGLSSVLDEVEDDFRLTIFKMKPEQKPLAGRSYAPATHFDAYSMMGRGTVAGDYAAQALDRVLRPLGLPEQADVVGRFHRY